MIKRIKKCFIISIAVIASLVFSSCKSAEIVDSKPMPSWISSSRSVYPDENFLTYIGEGDTRNEAEIQSVKGLASIMGQDVNVITGASKRMSEAKKDGLVAMGSESGFSQNIMTSVDVDNLIGVEIKDYWFDGRNTWYAIAVLDKAKASDLYEAMIIKNNEAISSLIKNANEDFYSLQSMSEYDFAQEIAIENKKNLDKLYVIDFDSASALKNDVVMPEKMAEKKFEIAKEIPIYIFISGDRNDTYKSAFLDAIADFGFSGSSDASVRYAIEGSISLNYETTSDGKTVKCYYDLESNVIDKENSMNIFPINIRGRQAHRSEEEAYTRVKNDIIKQIEILFNEQFSNYLGSYFGK